MPLKINASLISKVVVSESMFSKVVFNFNCEIHMFFLLLVVCNLKNVALTVSEVLFTPCMI
ncbi:MAG: hypothetical protein H6Q14_1934 [Bacteroidetes bacterium]|nr:hypothetical protein [Bacteroidota bacterium]